MALLTDPVGEGDADGEGVPVAFELELLPGSVAQPAAAKVARAMISPRVVFLIVFILDLPRLLIFSDMRSGSLSSSLFSPFAYFGLLGLVLGEADAAGEGLAAGLSWLAGAVSVAPLGEAAVDAGGLVGVGEFELLAGSQPAANPIEAIVRSSSPVRLIMFMFGVLIFSLISTRLKSGMIIA